MTAFNDSDFARAMRDATDGAPAAMDVLVRDLKLSPGHPIAVALEAQREIILSLGRLSELVAEVRASQAEALESPELRAALAQGAEIGADAGFKHVAGEMRRRTLLGACMLAAGMVVLGGIAITTGFTMGSKHELRTLVADCLRHGTPLTLDGERVCAVLMSPKKPAPVL